MIQEMSVYPHFGVPPDPDTQDRRADYPTIENTPYDCPVMNLKDYRSQSRPAGAGRGTADTIMETAARRRTVSKIDALILSSLSVLWEEILTSFAICGEGLGGFHSPEEDVAKWREDDLDDLLNVEKRS